LILKGFPSASPFRDENHPPCLSAKAMSTRFWSHMIFRCPFWTFFPGQCIQTLWIATLFCESPFLFSRVSLWSPPPQEFFIVSSCGGPPMVGTHPLVCILKDVIPADDSPLFFFLICLTYTPQLGVQWAVPLFSPLPLPFSVGFQFSGWILPVDSFFLEAPLSLFFCSLGPPRFTFPFPRSCALVISLF